MNLYELSNRFQQLLDQDELSENDCKELDSIHADGEQQCISYARYIRNKQAELLAVETARKEMQEREKSLANNIDRKLDFLTCRMAELKFSKIITPEFTITIKLNPVSVNDYAKGEIPEKFWVTKISETKSLDKAAIKEAIQAGEEVPGANLIQKFRIDFK